MKEIGKEQIDGRTVSIIKNDSVADTVVFCNSISDDWKSIAENCDAIGCPPFHLVLISGLNWDEDLSPWPAGRIISNRDNFTGHANDYLDWLLSKILPLASESHLASNSPLGSESHLTSNSPLGSESHLASNSPLASESHLTSNSPLGSESHLTSNSPLGSESHLTSNPETPAPKLKKVLAGYSMAGLFALYAAYRTGAFDGIVSASGSVWFPNFSAYAVSTPLNPAPKCIYLSLGDAESNSRNQCLQQTESITRSLFEHYRDSGIPSTFELNSGNHFKDYDLRLAKGIAWALRNLL